MIFYAFIQCCLLSLKRLMSEPIRLDLLFVIRKPNRPIIDHSADFVDSDSPDMMGGETGEENVNEAPDDRTKVPIENFEHTLTMKL